MFTSTYITVELKKLWHSLFFQISGLTPTLEILTISMATKQAIVVAQSPAADAFPTNTL